MENNALISMDTLEHLLDLKDIYQNATLLATQDEGSVYLTGISKFGKQYILKKRNTLSTTHEFNIGSKVKHPNMARAFLYFECPCDWLPEKSSFLLMEKASGKDYAHIKPNLLEDESRIFIRHLCMIIADIQDTYKFTHYDLHGGNMLISLGPYREERYRCYGREYSIVTPFTIKIIDYGYSHLEGVYGDYVEVNYSAMINGAVPNVYDPFFDMTYVITWWLRSEKIINKRINDLLIFNSFIPYEGQISSLSELDKYKDKELFYLGREYNPDWLDLRYYPEWVFSTDPYYSSLRATKGTLIRYTGDLVIDLIDYYNSVVEPKERVRLDRTDPMPIYKRIVEMYKSGNYQQLNEIANNYRIRFGGLMKYLKEEKIKKRPITPKQLFETILEEIPE